MDRLVLFLAFIVGGLTFTLAATVVEHFSGLAGHVPGKDFTSGILGGTAGGAHDYDCDGSSTPRWAPGGGCVTESDTTCTVATGMVGAPACGTAGDYWGCAPPGTCLCAANPGAP